MNSRPIILVQPAGKAIYFHWISPNLYHMLIFLYFLVTDVTKAFGCHKKKWVGAENKYIIFYCFL